MGRNNVEKVDKIDEKQNLLGIIYSHLSPLWYHILQPDACNYKISLTLWKHLVI